MVACFINVDALYIFIKLTNNYMIVVNANLLLHTNKKKEKYFLKEALVEANVIAQRF